VTDPEPALLLELTKARAHIAELIAERDRLGDKANELVQTATRFRAERDAMRPVVDAVAPVANWARGWHPGLALGKLVTAYDAWRAAQPDQKGPSGPRVCRTNDIRRHAAPKWIVDGEYRCDFCLGVMRDGRPDLVAVPIDQMTPTDRPSATETQDQGADDGAGTEGSQAQEGAQGDCGVCGAALPWT
jgi:hypothetical protein